MFKFFPRLLQTINQYILASAFFMARFQKPYTDKYFCLIIYELSFNDILFSVYTYLQLIFNVPPLYLLKTKIVSFSLSTYNLHSIFSLLTYLQPQFYYKQVSCSPYLLTTNNKIMFSVSTYLQSTYILSLVSQPTYTTASQYSITTKCLVFQCPSVFYLYLYTYNQFSGIGLFPLKQTSVFNLYLLTNKILFLSLYLLQSMSTYKPHFRFQSTYLQPTTSYYSQWSCFFPIYLQPTFQFECYTSNIHCTIGGKQSFLL